MDCSRRSDQRGRLLGRHRKFFDVHAATASPIAKEALDGIGQLYAVEQTINGSSSDQRLHQRQLRSKPIAEALAAWAEETVPKLSRKSELAAAFRYIRARWTALARCSAIAVMVLFRRQRAPAPTLSDLSSPSA
jgi:hypothetical protein